MAIPSETFARELGDALQRFLEAKGIPQAVASKRLGMLRATLNAYCHDTPQGDRRLANAEVFVKACIQLGFEFEYEGHRISAIPTAAGQNGNGKAPSVSKQLQLEFDGQINLTDGTLSVSVKRPPGRVEVNVSLKARVS